MEERVGEERDEKVMSVKSSEFKHRTAPDADSFFLNINYQDHS